MRSRGLISPSHVGETSLSSVSISWESWASREVMPGTTCSGWTLSKLGKGESCTGGWFRRRSSVGLLLRLLADAI